MPTKIFGISPDAVHEVIDGEAIIINMATGSYYNLDGSGGLVWELLQKGACSSSTLADALNPAFTASKSQIEADVDVLLNELLAEGLLIFAQQATQLDVLFRDIPQSFESPILNKYSDLEALLLIDPIHDVTSDGWPHIPSEEK